MKILRTNPNEDMTVAVVRRLWRTERAVSALCHGLASGGYGLLVALKKGIGRGPRERCRSVPRGGVQQRIGRGPRERCRSVRRGGV